MALVGLEDRGAVRHVILQRAEKRNAFNRELLDDLGHALGAAAADSGVRVVVVRGDGPMFSSGMDLNDLRELSENPEGLRRFRRPILHWWNLLEEMPKPTICQIHGAALGGAFELALACDFLVASERARFADTHARVGIMPGWGLTVLLPEAVGVRRAKELSTTGNFLDAATALSWGLVNHVVPHEELLPLARKLAADIAGVDRRAVRRMLRTYDEGALLDGAGAWALEAEVAGEWQGRGLDPAVIESNRQAVIARGRQQV